jgi:outer membrane protein, heavy metal efflux system
MTTLWKHNVLELTMKTNTLKTRIIGLLVCAVNVAISPVAPAATNDVEQLTLEQALQMAERRQPELAEARALIEAAAGRAEQAGKFPNPDGITKIEQAPFNGRTLGEAQYLAGIAQPVPLGGRLSKARETEQLERERRVSELEVRRRELRRRVHSAFATTLYQEQAFQSQTKIAESTEKTVTLARSRVDAGDALPEDVARAEMELARARIELRRSTSLREQALFALVTAIGDPSLSVRSLAGELDATFEIPTLESLAADLSANPTAVAADAAVRVESARVDLAKAQRIPDVKVEVLYRRLQAEKENTFDVGLSIPLPLFDRNQGRLREARAELQAAEARSRATRNELSFQLREAHSQLTTALATSRALHAEILPRADTVLRAAEARYAAGDASLNDVLPVRRDWAAMRLTYLESLRDALQAWATVRSLARTTD